MGNIKLKEHIENKLNKYNDIFIKYPNRRKEIHKVACKNCPSVFNKENNIIDLEIEDIKDSEREYQIEMRFCCGWRPSKLCKGYCDEFNINENYLSENQ